MAAQPSSLHKKTWLLAEDDSFTALLHFRILDSILPKESTEIICVKHGDEVLKAIRKEEFEAWGLDGFNKLVCTGKKVVSAWDAFILDCQMPISICETMDAGIILARAIRDQDKNVKILVCSSQDRAEFKDPNLFSYIIEKSNFRGSMDKFLTPAQ